MPVLIKNLRGTRNDPRRSPAKKAGNPQARRGPIMIGLRSLKEGKRGILAHEGVLAANKAAIQRWFDAGVLDLKVMPNSTPEEMALYNSIIGKPAQPAPVVEVVAVVEENIVVDGGPVPEDAPETPLVGPEHDISSVVIEPTDEPEVVSDQDSAEAEAEETPEPAAEKPKAKPRRAPRRAPVRKKS